MLWAQKNTLNEGHVFVVQGVFDPKQLNIKTCKEISRNDRYLNQYREERRQAMTPIILLIFIATYSI